MPRPEPSPVWVAALLVAAASSACGQEAPAAKEQEATLIGVLKSEAPQKAKADACMQLARLGTQDAVPALAALLGDEKLAHMARYGLETIPSPAVEDALREALGRVKGPLLVGVIASLGVRRDEKAVELLAKLLGDADADVAQAAARALGSIGTPAAAKALDGALANVPAANQVAFCEGLLRCAEALAAKDQRAEAQALYDRLRTVKPAPHQVRTGALRGAVLMRQAAGIPLLLEALRGEDYVLVEAAARTAMEFPGVEVTKALADELPKLPADKQILLTLTLAKRKDGAAEAALGALAKSGEKPVRLAAIRALGELGSAGAMPVLLGLLGDAERDVAQAAQDALAGVSGPESDAAVAAMLTQPDVKTRLLAIEMLGQRRTLGAVPGLLKAAEDAEEGVRVASIKALGEMAGAAELPALIGVLLKAKSPAELQAAENSLAALCLRQAKPVAGKVVIRKAVYGGLPDGPQADVTKKVEEMVKAGSLTIDASNDNFGDPANGVQKKLRIEYSVEGRMDSKTVNEGETVTLSAVTATTTPQACIDALCAALAQAPTGPKIALLRVLRGTGSPKALESVRAAAAGADAQLKEAATSILCDWPTAAALPDVTELAKTSADPKVKILALRGLIRLTGQLDAPPEKKLATLKEAMAQVERNEEKKLALAALSTIPTAEALALVLPHLSNAAVKEEAALAAVVIGEKIVQANSAQVAEAMEQVVQATANRDTSKRAKALLQQAKKGK
jgi:HEAT repeat protein